jgi:hypothetical protein
VTNRRVNAIAKRLSLRSSQRHLPEASVKIERLDDFLGRACKLARLADAGKPIPESFVISFRIKWARLDEQSGTNHSCTA